MLMQRYFIQFAYWGKRFRGLQKQDHRPLKLHQLPEEEIISYYEKDEKTVQVIKTIIIMGKSVSLDTKTSL